MSFSNYIPHMNGKHSFENYDADDPNKEQREANVFKCHECRANFHTKELLNEHLKCHPDFPCQQCGKVFKNKHYLAQHLLVHSKDSPTFKCETCGKFFKRKAALAQHGKLHTENRPLYPCKICGRMLKNRLGINEHIKYMHNDKLELHPCEICGTTFKRKRHLNRHIADVHLQQKPEGSEPENPENSTRYPCDVCGKTLKTEKLVARHVQLYHQDFPGYDCEKCSKNFKRKDHCNNHVKICHGQTTIDRVKPYLCHLCSQGFSNSHSLKRHLEKIHLESSENPNICHDQTTAKPYLCHLCSQGFSNAHSLRRHLDNIHSESSEKPNLLCHLCSKGFANPHSLKRHLYNIHKLQSAKYTKSCLLCHICGKNCFQNPKMLVDHLKKKHDCEPPEDLQKRIYKRETIATTSADGKLICSICLEKFDNYNRLKYHRAKAHLGKTFKYKRKKRICPFCGKGFTYKSGYVAHVNAHTGYRQFKCPLCPVAVTAKSNLNLHMKSHYNKNPLYCRGCNILFCTKDKFETHRQEVHVKKNPFTCPKCLLGFNDEVKYKSHILRGHRYDIPDEDKKYVCKFCSKRFVDPKSCIKHITKCPLNPQSTSNKAQASTQLKQPLITTASLNKTEDTLIYEYVCKICYFVFNGNKDLITHFSKVHSNANPSDETVLCVYSKREELQYGCKDPYFTPRSILQHGKAPFFCKVCHRPYHSKNGFHSHMEKFHPEYLEEPPILEGDESDISTDKSLEGVALMQEYACKQCFFVTSEIRYLYGHMRLECDILCEPDEVLYCLNTKDEEREYRVVDEFFSQNDSMFKKAGFICKICLAPFALRIFYDRHITKKHPQLVEEYQDNFLDVEETFSEGNALSIPSSDLDFSEESSGSDACYEDEELDMILKDKYKFIREAKRSHSKRKRTRGKTIVTSSEEDDTSEDETPFVSKRINTRSRAKSNTAVMENFKGPLPDFFTCAFCKRLKKKTVCNSFEKMEEHYSKEHSKLRGGSTDGSNSNYEPEIASDLVESSEGYVPSDDDVRSKNTKIKTNLKIIPITLNKLKDREVVEVKEVADCAVNNYRNSGKVSKETAASVESTTEAAAKTSNTGKDLLTFTCKACQMVYFFPKHLETHISKTHPDYYEVFPREEFPKFSYPLFKRNDDGIAVLPLESPDVPEQPKSSLPDFPEPVLPKLPNPELVRKIYGIREPPKKTNETSVTDGNRQIANDCSVHLEQSSKQTSPRPGKHAMEASIDILDEVLSSLSNSRNNSNAEPVLAEPAVANADVRCLNTSISVGHFQPVNVIVQGQNVNPKTTECYTTHAGHNFSNSCVDCPRFFENLPREFNMNNFAFGGQPPNQTPMYQNRQLSEYERFCNVPNSNHYTNLQNAHNYGASSFSQTVPPHQNYPNPGSLSFNPNPTMSSNFAPLGLSNFVPTPVQNVANHVNNLSAFQNSGVVPSNFGFINAYQNSHVNPSVAYENHNRNIPINVNAVNEKSDSEDGGSFGIPDCNFADSDSSVDDPVEGGKKTFTDISNAKKSTVADTDKTNESRLVDIADDPDDPKISETTIQKPTQISPPPAEKAKDDVRVETDKKLLEEARSKVFFCDECPSYYKFKPYILKHYREFHPTCTDKIKSLLETVEKTKGNNKDKACYVCNKVFDSNAALKRHVNGVHENLRPWKCDECPLSFKEKTGLKKHKFTHLNIRPFKCDQCSLSFKDKNGLKKHKLTHLNFNPEKCDLCTFSCKLGYELLKHKRNAHGNSPKRNEPKNPSTKKKGRPKKGASKNDIEKPEGKSKKPFSCEECNTYYYNREFLLTHYENNHSQCLDIIETLKKQVENEAKNLCSVCDESFPSREDLENHVVDVHGKGSKSSKPLRRDRVPKKRKNVKSRQVISCSESGSDSGSSDTEHMSGNEHISHDEKGQTQTVEPTPRNRPSRACRPKNLKEAD